MTKYVYLWTQIKYQNFFSNFYAVFIIILITDIVFIPLTSKS